MADNITIVPNQAELERQFAFVNSIIERYRSSAISMVNTAAPRERTKMHEANASESCPLRQGRETVATVVPTVSLLCPSQVGLQVGTIIDEAGINRNGLILALWSHDRRC